jgi:hypothetical protein
VSNDPQVPPEPRPAETADADAPQEDRRLEFPTAVTMLAMVLIVISVESFFIPAGCNETNAAGGPQP